MTIQDTFCTILSYTVGITMICAGLNAIANPKEITAGLITVIWGALFILMGLTWNVI